jgi:hypothetical protein
MTANVGELTSPIEKNSSRKGGRQRERETDTEKNPRRTRKDQINRASFSLVLSFLSFSLSPAYVHLLPGGHSEHRSFSWQCSLYYSIIVDQQAVSFRLERMSSTDDSYSMTSSLSSSLDQTPLSSLSAASSYASLVNCDETVSVHLEEEQQHQQQHQQLQDQQPILLEKKSRKNSARLEGKLPSTSDSNNPTQKTNNGSSTSNKRSCYSTLQNRHVNKLCSILEDSIEIHGQGNFPTLNIVPKDFLIELRRAFHLNQIDIKDVRLNGGKLID